MLAAAFGLIAPVGGALLQEAMDVAVILEDALRVLRIVPAMPPRAAPSPGPFGAPGPGLG